MLIVRNKIIQRICVLLAISIGFHFLTGCDKMSKFQGPNAKELGEKAVSAGDFPRAVNFYEAALDGTPDTANIHYRLAILYDNQMKDPVAAIHHYRRFMLLSESKDKHGEIEQSISRLQRGVATRLGEGGLVSRAEAVNLRNDNNTLRQQLAALRGDKKNPNSTGKPPVDAKGFSKVTKTREVEKAVGSETRTHTVKKGETLASIARKYYKTSNRWQDIVDANQNQMQGSSSVREGQVLIIP